MTAICVCNYSGNVGKSTISVQLLGAFSKFPVLSVETFNTGAEEGSVEVRNSTERSVVESLTAGMDCIIDLGSANLREVIAAFADFAGVGDDIDLWLIPVTPDAKVIRDTLATARHIMEVGARNERIMFILNMVKITSQYEAYFSDFVNEATAMGASICSVVIFESDVFDNREMLETRSLRDWAEDQTDYRSVCRDREADAGVRDVAVRNLMMVRQSRSTVVGLEAAFEEIMSKIGER